METNKINVVAATFLMLLFFSACKKPAHIDSVTSINELLPTVRRVTLSDTLSPAFSRTLHLDDIMGIQFQYISGNVSSYFEYHADKHDVLKAIGTMGFSKSAGRADTICRNIEEEKLRHMQEAINDTEVSGADFFWQNNLEEYDVYECLKSPVSHLILISKQSNKIIHRIETKG